MNKEQKKIKGKIETLLKEFYRENLDYKFEPGRSKIPLMSLPYGYEEVLQAVDSLLSGNLTLNQNENNKVQQFEEKWSQFVGTRFGVMVNSGSSANLLALFSLANPERENPIKPGDEIITPALTWHTTISPILCIGAVPVLVDANLYDLTINVEEIEAQITAKTKAILPVHLLGNPCQMDLINEIAERYGLYVIEDACEAHGASFQGKNCGSIGTIGTFSFFFSHHITTIEGGMVMTDDEDLAELCRIMRSQGVIRNALNRGELAKKYKKNDKYKDIDESYLFANLGFNLRPTEINGGFGIEQAQKLDSFLSQRRNNASYWKTRLETYQDFFYLSEPTSEGESAWFGFPFIVKPKAGFSRDQITQFLNRQHIETRPIMSGNIIRQPAMAHFQFRNSSLTNAELVHQNGFFWGNHQGIKEDQREYMADCIDEFINNTKSHGDCL